MKRIHLLSLLLTAVLLLSAFAAAPELFHVSAADAVNVALGCPYTGTEPYTLDVETYGKTNYRYKVGTELTDGIKGDGGDPDNRWYAFYRSGTWHIDVDLGETKSSLCEFHTEFLDLQSWGIRLPETVRYYGSVDGTNFTLIGEASKEKKTSAYTDYYLRLSNTASARYVRMELVSGATFAFASEIEVYQGEAVFEDKFELREGVYAKLTDQAFRIPPKTDVSQIPAMINSMDGVTFTDGNGNPKKSGILKTGDELHKTHSILDVLRIYYFVVDGDLNGDGVVNAKDYLMVKRAALSTLNLEGAAFYAADVDCSGKLNAKDYAIIKRHALNTYDLYEAYGPTDGRGDVTKKFAGRIDVTDRIENPETWDMTIKRTSSKQYTITSETSFGTITQTIHQTAWGTWNLGAWVLNDTAGRHAFASESTDWEYVYRAGKTKSSNVFSGGNHANEKLRSFKMFDGTDNREITLAVNESTTVKQLRITEETKLYYDPTGDNGVYNYSEDDMYCYAVRNYTIVGPQIRLEVDYDYKKDVYYGLSYTCMMPIEKTLGLYCAYVNENGTLDKIYETLKKGDPNYNGPFYFSDSANRAILFGYSDSGSIPKYRIDVRTDPGADTLNPAGKERSRFWDMNLNTNKLYFCLYGNGELVKTGSTRHTYAQWTMYVD